MATTIKEVMNTDVVTLPVDSPITKAASIMRDRGIGDVVVLALDRDEICGIVTDRDITVRAVAEGRDVNGTKLGDICSREIVSLTPEDTVEEAVKLMRDKAIRRLPIVENGKPVGFVSIGDLAVTRDPDSALADISSAKPNK